MKKKCGDCGRELLVKFFEIIKRTNKYYTYCKECHRRHTREYTSRTKKTRYKIRLEQSRLWAKKNHARRLEIQKKSQDKLSILPINKYKAYKREAKRYNRIFNINLDFFTKIISQDCHYCGIPDKSGVDRKDNNIGYIEENCLPCCHCCNSRKRQMSYKKFISKIKKDEKTGISK